MLSNLSNDLDFPKITYKTMRRKHANCARNARGKTLAGCRNEGAFHPAKVCKFTEGQWGSVFHLSHGEPQLVFHQYLFVCVVQASAATPVFALALQPYREFSNMRKVRKATPSTLARQSS